MVSPIEDNRQHVSPSNPGSAKGVGSAIITQRNCRNARLFVHRDWELPCLWVHGLFYSAEDPTQGSLRMMARKMVVDGRMLVKFGGWQRFQCVQAHGFPEDCQTLGIIWLSFVERSALAAKLGG